MSNFNSVITSFRYDERLEKIKRFLLRFLGFKNAVSYENPVLKIDNGFVHIKKGDMFPTSSIASVSISRAPKIKYPLGLLEFALLKVLFGDILSAIFGFATIASSFGSIVGQRSPFSSFIFTLYTLFIIGFIVLYILIAILNFFRGYCFQFILVSGKSYCMVSRDMKYMNKVLICVQEALHDNKEATFDFSNSTIVGSVINPSNEAVTEINIEDLNVHV